MKTAFSLFAALCLSLTATAQNGFTHGPGAGIESQYFDTSLAPFYHGVASGDPLDDRVIIWTRVTPERDTLIPVLWKVATDTSFTQVVQSGTATTDYTKDYTVKVDVSGLQQGVTYYYYFSALGRNSIIGKTHTLPLSTVQHLRFAVVSCANYQMGYFNGYKRISERPDLDAVLHLGDYIYEYPTYGYGYTTAVDRRHQPEHEIVSLDDYRIRHSFYKLDRDLRAAHQQVPFIAIWDDHEIVNNSYEDGAQSHNAATAGDYETRKQSAIRAYLEWMPIRHPAYTYNAKIYRRFTYGSLADLLMLDTRIEGRDPQVSSANSPALTDPSRRILGDTQRAWMINNLQGSSATWKILGNQVMFSQEGPGPDLDTWTGYPVERQIVLNALKAMPTKNNVILTGDTHRSWAFDLTEHPYDTAHYKPLTGQGTFGVELCAMSVASPNRNESAPNTSQAPFTSPLYSANPQLRFVDLDNHGYFVMDITPAKLQADFFFVDTKFRSSRDSFGRGMYTFNGQGYLQQATSPATPKAFAASAAPQGPAPFAIPQPTGIAAPTLMLSGIYPNPARDFVFVGLALNEAKTLTFALTDASGREKHRSTLSLAAGNHKVRVPIEARSPGIYLLSVGDGQGYYQVRKIEVE